jgi:hypothetical protein
MANDHIPNDPHRAGDPDAPYRTKPRSDPADDRAARLDNELQMNRELAEGPLSGNRIALYAVGIAVVLGAVFYGLNNSSIKEASTTPANPASTAQNTAPASPRANSQPGMTTGAASSTTNPASHPKAGDPKAPPAPAPSGGTE